MWIFFMLEEEKGSARRLKLAMPRVINNIRWLIVTPSVFYYAAKSVYHQSCAPWTVPLPPPPPPPPHMTNDERPTSDGCPSRRINETRGRIYHRQCSVSVAGATARPRHPNEHFRAVIYWAWIWLLLWHFPWETGPKPVRSSVAEARLGLIKWYGVWFNFLRRNAGLGHNNRGINVFQHDVLGNAEMYCDDRGKLFDLEDVERKRRAWKNRISRNS